MLFPDPFALYTCNTISLVLSYRLEFNSERDSELFASAPASAAVFLLRGVDEASEPYISKTSNLRRRLQRLLGASDQSRKLNLRDRVRWVEWTPTGSDFEASFLLYKTLRRVFPRPTTSACVCALHRWSSSSSTILIRGRPSPRASAACEARRNISGRFPRGRPPKSLPTTRLTCSRCAAAPSI